MRSRATIYIPLWLWPDISLLVWPFPVRAPESRVIHPDRFYLKRINLFGWNSWDWYLVCWLAIAQPHSWSGGRTQETLTIQPVLSELGITSLRVGGLAQRMGQRTDGLMTGALLNTFVLVVSRGLRHDKTRNSSWSEMKQEKRKKILLNKQGSYRHTPCLEISIIFHYSYIKINHWDGIFLFQLTGY